MSCTTLKRLLCHGVRGSKPVLRSINVTVKHLSHRTPQRKFEKLVLVVPTAISSAIYGEKVSTVGEEEPPTGC